MTYPQIPVLFTATVISPSLRASPFSTSALEGLVSATQRSWPGFVKTPMFSRVGLRVVVVSVVDMLTVRLLLEYDETERKKK